MDKHGYKNISSRNEFEKNSKTNGKVNYGPVEGKHITRYDFVDWGSQGNWGMPGETRYEVKDLKDLIGAGDKMSKPIMKDRKPTGYVGW